MIPLMALSLIVEVSSAHMHSEQVVAGVDGQAHLIGLDLNTINFSSIDSSNKNLGIFDFGVDSSAYANATERDGYWRKP